MNPAAMRRDVLSAYAASGAKVLSWVIVSAVVFRAGEVYFAILALIRGTLGLLNYTTVGLAPALIRLLAEARARPLPVLDLDESGSGTLSYARPSALELRRSRPVDAAYLSGLAVALLSAGVALTVLLLYAATLFEWHYIPYQVTSARTAVILVGLGVILRLTSEAPAAVIQTGGWIGRDNAFLVVSELTWIALTPVGRWHDFGYVYRGDSVLHSACAAYALSGLLLLLLRLWVAARIVPLSLRDGGTVFIWGDVRRLLGLGSLIALAQLADFLYAPIDYVLINRLIGVDAVAQYAPAVQIDAGLFVLVAALSAVLLPKAALAHTAGDVTTLRGYYVRGTLLSAVLLMLSGVAVYFLSPWIFRVWLGNPMSATQAILPLVLIHTVLGGSAAVGRSILLGMGKVKAFAVAALVAGAANVVLSYAFVKYGGLGLKGIVYGTILAVIGRCVIWQPWYVLRTLRREGASADARAGAVVPPPQPL